MAPIFFTMEFSKDLKENDHEMAPNFFTTEIYKEIIGKWPFVIRFTFTYNPVHSYGSQL